MRALSNARGSRAISYVLLGAAFLVAAGYAGVLTFSLRERQRADALGRARGDLLAMVQIWEDSALQRSAAWLSELSEDADPRRREAAIRRSTPALDALYLWTVGDQPALRHPASPRERAPEGKDAARLAAALREAEALLLADDPQAAWEALALDDLPVYAPLADTRAGELPLSALLLRRVVASTALGAMGDRHRQKLLLTRTASEVASLPAPMLLTVRPWLTFPLETDLELLGEADELGVLRVTLGGAARRADGLTELTRRLRALTVLAEEDARAAAAPSEGEVLTGDQGLSASDLLIEAANASGDGFVLLYALLPERDLGGAAQWSTRELLDELLRLLQMDARQGEPTVLDAEGRVVRGDARCAPGTPGDGAAVWVQVPLGRLLPQLRLGLCALPGQPPPHADPRQLLAQLAPILLALLLGGAAFAARAGADRRQRELYERQRDFVARVTHELKTPLAGIRVMAETLEIGAFRDAAQREHLASRIVAEVDRLGARVDEVLRVSRRDHPQAPEPVALDALAAELVDTWRERFAARGATLEADLRPCPPIPAERALLRDAVNNLLDNALKYLREDRPGWCLVATRTEGRWVVVEVCDNGLGVPPGLRRAIFEPFVRVEGPGRGKAGGHGLGLAFVAETARAHGGTVECRESPEGGARFTLRLRRRRWKRGGSRASSSSKTTTPSRSGS